MYVANRWTTKFTPDWPALKLHTYCPYSHIYKTIVGERFSSIFSTRSMITSQSGVNSLEYSIILNYLIAVQDLFTTVLYLSLKTQGKTKHVVALNQT